jgi:hypothetical protein
MSEDLSSCSVKELKVILKYAGVPIPTGIEKHELVALAVLAKSKKPTTSKPNSKTNTTKDQGKPFAPSESCSAEAANGFWEFMSQSPNVGRWVSIFMY